MILTAMEAIRFTLKKDALAYLLMSLRLVHGQPIHKPMELPRLDFKNPVSLREIPLESPL